MLCLEVYVGMEKEMCGMKEYVRYREHESHVIGFQEIWGIREIKWERENPKNSNWKAFVSKNWGNGLFQKIKIKTYSTFKTALW